MSIYTRKGDTGQTSLADGSRIAKASLRVEAYGAVDEANSHVGLAVVATGDVLLRDVLTFVQQRLMNAAASLALPVADGVVPTGLQAHAPAIAPEDVAFLESAIDSFEQFTGPVRAFVVEGGCETAARLHVARAVLRRAERRTDALAAVEPVDVRVLAFLNRASDVLFAAARYANHQDGAEEALWDPDAPEPMLPKGETE